LQSVVVIVVHCKKPNPSKQASKKTCNYALWYLLSVVVVVVHCKKQIQIQASKKTHNCAL
jgi:hypothetical protein